MFLIKSDFLRVMSVSDLNDIIEYTTYSDQNLTNEVDIVTEDVKGYLRARYDVAAIFKDITLHASATIYAVGDKVYTVSGSTYKKYICIKATTNGILITNTTYWTESDNRNKKIVEICTDITVYNLISRLNNYDLPQHRRDRYDNAIKWLESVAKGNIEPDIPLLEANQDDQTGNVVMYGYAEDSTENNTSF